MIRPAERPSCLLPQWVEIGLASRQGSSPNLSFQLERLGAIGADDEPVAQPLVDERSDERVERQGAGGELLLLGRGKARDHKAVTDIYAELIARAAARRVGVEPGPQSLRPDPAAVTDLQVLGRHRPTAHADIQKPVALPDGIDAGRAPRYLFVRPVLEAVKWPGLQFLHSNPPRPDANQLVHENSQQ
jgi:hypothetical protein